MLFTAIQCVCGKGQEMRGYKMLPLTLKRYKSTTFKGTNRQMKADTAQPVQSPEWDEEQMNRLKRE